MCCCPGHVHPRLILASSPFQEAQVPSLFYSTRGCCRAKGQGLVATSMPKSEGGLISALVGQPILVLKVAQESLTLKATPDLSYMRSTPSPESSIPETEVLSGKQLAPGQAFFNSDMVFWPKQRGCSAALCLGTLHTTNSVA